MPASKRLSTSMPAPRVRRLEERRVLNAAVQALLLPPSAAEGEFVRIGADIDPDPTNPFAPLSFDWTITRDGSVVATSDRPRIGFIPTDDGTHEVSLTLNGDSSTRVTALFNVDNVAPDFGPVFVTPATEEGQTTQLVGLLFDPGIDDTLTLDIDWGDGTQDTLTLSGGVSTFLVSHTYADDNPTGTPADIYDIRLTVTDDEGASSERTLSTLVTNVRPRILDLEAENTIEGEQTVLRGRIVDPGVEDTFRLRINWGDGTTEIVQLDAGTTEFEVFHTYADDNPTGTSADLATIRVRLIDDDLGRAFGRTNVLIRNAAPILEPIPEGRVDEGELLSLSDLSSGGLRFTDLGKLDTHMATIDWGDGSASETLSVSFTDGEGRLNGDHTYADNGTYTARITLVDDDGGQTVATFQVVVNNVAPALAGTGSLVVDEGEAFTLAALGVSVTDPGFDNPLAPGGATEETFLDGMIDWGDGTTATPVTFVSRVSGSPGQPTIAIPEHAEHVYADNGTYTIRVTLSDDDGGLATRSFQIVVNNVAPTLTLNDPQAVINEGDRLELPTFGTFTDPGFDNPLSPTTESFSYTIDWGDGTVETGVLPASVVQGGPGVLTLGALSDGHTYADNDADNAYTVTVTLADDDGGIATGSFEVTVLNVAPTLDPIAATDLEGDGITTLTLSFEDPGADTFEILVDWGDRPDLPPEDRFVVEQVHVGPTPTTYVIQHQYTGPPDPTNPSADILIRVKIRDDDFGTPGTLELGESNVESVAISNPGIEENKVAIDTTPQAPPVEFPDRPELPQVIEQVSASQGNLGTGQVGAAASEGLVVSDRFLELRVVAPDGVEADGIRLSVNALDDLPSLFENLPDNHYRVYLIQEETNSERLVIDVNARGGRLIDPSDDSDGARDRPPTAEDPTAEEPAAETPAADSGAEEASLGPLASEPGQIGGLPQEGAGVGIATSVVGVGLIASADYRAWRDRVAAALKRGDASRWKQLRRSERLLRRRPR